MLREVHCLKAEGEERKEKNKERYVGEKRRVTNATAGGKKREADERKIRWGLEKGAGGVKKK